MNNQKKINKLSQTVIKELFGEFVNVLFGNVWNKIGLSIVLLTIALVCLLSPIVGVDNKLIHKPYYFYIAGGGLIIISFYLIVRRWKELQKKSKF